MRQQSYLVRKGARYHFRRRIGHPACLKPISISLGTADPGKARCLARRLAVKWDEVDMGMEILGGRRSLTLDEQESLFRQGLKDELARATAHITAPIGSEEPHPLLHKMMAMAYRIVMRMALLSGKMITRMIDKIDEQMALHLEIVDRLEAVRRLEERAIASPPVWALDIARMIESLGFDRLSIRSKGKHIVEDIRLVLVRHGSPSEDTAEMFDRIAERLVHSIDGASDDDDLKADTPAIIDDDAVFPMDSVIPREFGPDVQSSSPTLAGSDVPSGRVVEAFFAGKVGAKTASEPRPDEPRSGGFAMIDGLHGEYRFEGIYSQFERGEASPLDSSWMARIEEREGFGMTEVMLRDGVLPDAAWLRYEVAYGEYVMVQIRSASSVLPRLTNALALATIDSGMISGMLPPYASMAQYGEMVGVSGTELRSLEAWDAPGTGPAHSRPAVLDGSHGSPVQAYEVMKRAVGIHLSNVLGADASARISPLAHDHMARFWLFLVVGRMRCTQLEQLWPDGFFHGVEGHDVGLGNEGHLRLLRMNKGSIDALIG